LNWVNVFLIYILFWWVTLFMVLPFGVRGQAEEGEIVQGSEPGAPVQASIKKKFLITTVLSAIFCTIFFVIDYYNLIDLTELIP